MKWAPYQLKWLRDNAQQRACVKSRRIGFSEVVTFEAACRAGGIDLTSGKLIRPVPQNFISAGLEQSKDLLARALKHIEALEIAVGDLVETATILTVKLRSGVHLRAFSSNPRSIRSYEGDVVLDEFGSVPNPDKVWAAAAPLAKPTLGNPEGYRISVIGTPEGDENLFYEFTRGDKAKAWSQHTIDVHSAVKQGFPLKSTIEDLRDEIGDPDLFAQEYECSFLSASMRYISAQLYDSCLYDELDDPRKHAHYCAAGMDVARKQDNSAIARVLRLGDVLYVEPVEARRGVAWEDQEHWAGEVLRTTVGKMAIDSTGMGSQFTERLEAQYAGQVEGVDFTQQSKEMLATGLKLAFERKRIRVPRGDTELRRDVLALRRELTKAGNVRFDADRTKDGHADRAWALALAVYAAGGTVADNAKAPPVITGGRRKTAGLRGKLVGF